MDYREANELPEWVKLVNKVIHGNLTLEDLSPAAEAAAGQRSTLLRQKD